MSENKYTPEYIYIDAFTIDERFDNSKPIPGAQVSLNPIGPGFVKYVLESSTQVNFVDEEAFLDEVFPICLSKDMFTINLAGMRQHAPTGDNWGYAPFLKTYKTHDEAKQVRREFWETIKRWVDLFSKSNLKDGK